MKNTNKDMVDSFKQKKTKENAYCYEVYIRGNHLKLDKRETIKSMAARILDQFNVLKSQIVSSNIDLY